MAKKKSAKQLDTKPSRPFQWGDVVAIEHSEMKGPIVELRGPLAPGGVLVFRVRVRRKPKPAYIEVREDMITLIRPRKETPAEAPPVS